MIANLKSKRKQQIETLFSLINRNERGAGSHRGDLNLTYDFKPKRQVQESKESSAAQRRSHRIGSYHLLKKAGPTGMQQGQAPSSGLLRQTDSPDSARVHGSQVRRDLSRQRLFKKGVKCDLGDTVQTAGQRQLHSTTHKSQKVYHKRELRVNTTATEHHDPDFQSQPTVTDLDVPHLVQIMGFLFGPSSQDKRGSRPTVPKISEAKSALILIQEDNRPYETTGDLNAETLLQDFLCRLSLLESSFQCAMESQPSSRPSFPSKSARQYSRRPQRFLSMVKDFVFQLVRRVTTEFQSLNNKLELLLKQSFEQLNSANRQINAYKKQLESTFQSNQILLERVGELQTKAFNFGLISNQLSRSFDFEAFVKNRFVGEGVQQSKEKEQGFNSVKIEVPSVNKGDSGSRGETKGDTLKKVFSINIARLKTETGGGGNGRREAGTWDGAKS